MKHKNISVFTNNYKIKVLIIAILMISVTSLTTYGAFYIIESQNEQNTISSSCFSTSFSDGSSISLSGANAIPLSDEYGQNTDPYTFTITNTCNLTSMYYVILSTKSGSFSNDFINLTYNYGNIKTLSNLPLNDKYTLESGYSNSYIIGSGILENGDSQTSNVQLWINESATYTSGMTWEAEIKVVSIVLDQEKAMLAKSSFKPDFGVDSSGANDPYLVENLIPVVYDEKSSTWIKANTDQSGWYNYDKQIWANAVTVAEDVRYIYSVADPGTIIPMEKILGMYVWIPRYEYQYTNLGIAYAGGTAALPGAININFINNLSITETENYIIHPTFRNGSTTYTNNAYTTTSAYQVGGWDQELSGLWFAKFEISGSETFLKIIPNAQTLTGSKVAILFASSQSISANHGIELDSHMSKNSDWGAVAYLTQSKYGKYGNDLYTGANKEVYFNNSSSLYTGRSMGMPASTTGTGYTEFGTFRYYDTQNNSEINGTGASTTGNIYGIYDMVGGAREYLMANYGNNVGYSGLVFPNRKYYDLYTSTTLTAACGGLPCYGHSLSEISGWYSDSVSLSSSTSYWITRSNYYDSYNSASAGLFSNGYYTGAQNPKISSRVVLTIYTEKNE